VQLEVVFRDSSQDGFGVSFGDGSLDFELEGIGVGGLPGSVEAVASWDGVEAEEGPDFLGGRGAAEEGEGGEEDESDGEGPAVEDGGVGGVLRTCEGRY